MGLTESSNDEQIKNLFTGNTSYFTVPRYQRKYVWGEKNWKQLYEDIVYSMEDRNWSHFIGTFVFQKKDISPQNTEYIIIDGQQRIITLQIFFMAIIAALQSLLLKEPEDKEDIQRYIEIVQDLIKRKPPKGYGPERVVIEYDNNYKNLSDIICSDQSVEDYIKQSEKSNILQCFSYYYSLLKNLSFNQLIEFYEKVIITKYVGFNSYTEEYAYNIFETLNARGTQLKQLELMKNYMFHYLLPKDDIDVYKRQWIEAENILFSNNLDCDDFLYHLYKCTYNTHRIRIQDLYDQIKTQLNRDSHLIKSFYTTLIYCIPIYTSIINCDSPNDEIAFILKYYKIKNNRQFNSVMLALFYHYNKGTIQMDSFIDMIKKLRNFLLIYNIRSIAANKIDNDVHDLAYNIFNSKCERDIIYFVYLFLVKDRSFFSYNDVPKLISELRYSNRKRNSRAISSMFVYLFEMIFKTQYRDYEYLKDYSNWTIEHIINDCEDSEYVSRIGNLLPITKRLNSLCKNDPYTKKRIEYLNSGFSWIKDYAEQQQEEPVETDILKRSEMLANELTSLLTFDVSAMTQFCNETSCVIKFINALKKQDGEYSDYINDIKYDKFLEVKNKLVNKYHNQHLIELLGEPHSI